MNEMVTLLSRDAGMSTRSSPSPNIVSFVGAASPSRAHLLVNCVSDVLARQHGLELASLDLANAGKHFGFVDRTRLDAQSLYLIERIEGADAVVVGMPVYQGSYPGLFKHVFDIIHPAALCDKPVLLTAVGGGLRHMLMIEHQLRPLFSFFEAATVPTAIYASAGEITPGADLGPTLSARVADATAQFAALVRLKSSRLKGYQDGTKRNG